MRQASEITVSPPLRHVLHRIERPFFTPIYDLLSPQFAFGRVALIGDAAVVARPHVGYGTTKAAGDALSLARAVGNGSGDLATVLTHYHSDRYDLGERCFYRGQQLGAWISGAPPRTDQERGYAVFGYRPWHPAPRCKRRISSDVGNVGRTAAVSRGEAERAPSTCCRWSRERHYDLETGIDRRDYAAIATRVTSAHVVNA